MFKCDNFTNRRWVFPLRVAEATTDFELSTIIKSNEKSSEASLVAPLFQAGVQGLLPPHPDDF